MNFLSYENGISIPDALNVTFTGMVVVMIVLAVLAVLVVLLSKGIRYFEKESGKMHTDKEAEKDTLNAPEMPQAVSGVALAVNQSVGSLDLYKTDDKTTAVIMAIVSNECGIPLNKLKFNSIKLIED